jgi:hypothetical protein
MTHRELRRLESRIRHLAARIDQEAAAWEDIHTLRAHLSPLFAGRPEGAMDAVRALPDGNPNGLRAFLLACENDRGESGPLFGDTPIGQ